MVNALHVGSTKFSQNCRTNFAKAHGTHFILGPVEILKDTVPTEVILRTVRCIFKYSLQPVLIFCNILCAGPVYYGVDSC